MYFPNFFFFIFIFHYTGGRAPARALKLNLGSCMTIVASPDTHDSAQLSGMSISRLTERIVDDMLPTW